MPEFIIQKPGFFSAAAENIFQSPELPITRTEFIATGVSLEIHQSHSANSGAVFQRLQKTM
jgi:hypothetical protein